MREKQEILESGHRNALKASGPAEISIIHQLHMVEVIIDIRDILSAAMATSVDLKDIIEKRKGGGE